MTRGVKGEFMNDKATVEKFSEILLSILLHVQDAGKIPTPCKFFVANRSEDLEEHEGSAQEVLYHTDLIVSRAPKEDMIDLQVLKDPRCEIAELLADV